MSEDSIAIVTTTARSVREGKADILLPPNVFYNPVQEFNRDLTIAVISQVSVDQWNRRRDSNQSKRPGEPLRSGNPASQGAATSNASSETVNGGKESVDDVIEESPTESGVGVERDSASTVDVTQANVTDDMKIIKSDSTKTDRSDDTTTGSTNSLPEPGQRCPDGIRVLEGLAASGLRSVRFALEVPGVREIVANDFDRVAFDYIGQNAKRNNVTDILTPSYADAAMLMYQSRRTSDQFDVIDLDPYGSPSTFLDAAVQSVRDGGLLCVTCTDMAVLCGNATETCHAKYGSTSLRARFCHEMAVRILLRSIESHANRYSRYIVPLLSISVDFYCRVFVRVFAGQKRVKDSATKISNVYHCNGCGSFALQPLVTKTPMRNGDFKYAVSTGPPVGPRCAHCNGRFNLGGPIWSDPIHDQGFVERVIARVEGETGRFGTGQRILGVLSVVNEELVDQPLYYDTDHLCTVLHCTAIGFLPLRSALLHQGFKVSLSHANKNSLKTNAPSEVVWDVLRCWVKKNPVSADRLQSGSVAERILSKAPSFEANFSVHPDANPVSRRKGLVRWQLNPERDWGPKPRAARNRQAVEERKQAHDAKCRELKAKRRAENEEGLQSTVKSQSCKRARKGLCPLESGTRDSHAEETKSLEEQSASNPSETSSSETVEKPLNGD